MKKYIYILSIVLFSTLAIELNAENTTTLPSHVNSENKNNTELVSPASAANKTAEKLGLKIAKLSQIETIVNGAIAQKVFPGCQVLVMKNGETVYDRCFGKYTYESNEKVKPTTMYDLASLSKTSGTLFAIMKLYDSGKLSLNDKASKHLTFLRGTDKENITIKDLLFHESGLPGSLNFYKLVLEKKETSPSALKYPHHSAKLTSSIYKYNDDLVSKTLLPDYNIQVSDSLFLQKNVHNTEMQMIAKTRLGSKTYLYSCVNFILLKEIAETISRTPMDVYLNMEFYMPLKLKNMAYLPLRTHKKEDIAPTLKTDFLRSGLVQGFVHDPAAAFLGGVSGNAGLFANAEDVGRVYQILLNNGELDGTRYLSLETCKLFTTMTSASGRRGLGFDKPIPSNPKYSPCSPSAPNVVYGHTGYTGTCCWVDPKNQLVYVFLSNRTYPSDGVNKLAKLGIRTKIQELIYQSLQ